MRVRVAIAMTLMAVAVGSGVTTAAAAVVSGSSLAGFPTGVLFCGEPGSCTVAITDLPPEVSAAGGPRAGINGIVVSWRLKTTARSEDQPIRLRLLRGDAGVGTGPVVTLPKAAGTYEFPAQLPVKANDRFGVDLVNAKGPDGLRIFRPLTGASFGYWKPPLEDGISLPPNFTASNYEMLLNATIEPDADGDGFGDETQDKCPGRPDATNACPVGPIPTEPPPNTKVNEVRIEGTKAVFRFSATVKGSKFRCKLDKKPWKSCKSPKVYRGLKEGRHSFKVKAVGPTGVPDPTPAKRSFKVEL